jgi:hypothetical protein
MEDIKIIKIGDRSIAIKGIGKMFYQDGFPLNMAISQLADSGIEVSLFHVADELIKTGDFGLNKRGESVAYNRLSAALDDSIKGDIKPPTSKEELYKFCYADYETQREMIFNYLYKDRQTVIDIYGNLETAVKDLL